MNRIKEIIIIIIFPLLCVSYVIWHESGWIGIDIQADSDKEKAFIPYKLYLDNKLLISDSVFPKDFDVLNLYKLRTGFGTHKIKLETEFQEFNLEREIDVSFNKYLRIYFTKQSGIDSLKEKTIRSYVVFDDGYKWWR